MSASTESSQSKRKDVLSNLKLRLYLFRRKYASETGAKKIVVTIVMYLLIIGLAFVFIYPFLYMIINSLMTNSDLNSSSVH
ncbi:MAG: hypothetical protein J6Z46_06565, partial [Lachnospiraceae bacterium]|nr:hypothetical protein [Lachnospiraceae bacterium]